MPDLEVKTRDLQNSIASLENVVVAYSGGVDSTVLAVAAHRTLGPNALAVTAVSPSLAQRDRAAAARIAREAGFAHREITTHELDRDEYARNEPDRCFWCKTELFEVVRPIAEERGATIAVGTNVDDFGDHRPGIVAARRNGAAAPLAEAGFAKEDVRALARVWGIAVAEKSASPCLASRFAYGIRVTEEGLRRVEAAEEAIRTFGFTDFRVRDHGDLARVEVPAGDIERAATHASEIDRRLRDLGFRYVTLDLTGFRSGSLNEVLRSPTLRRPDRST